MDGYDLCRNSQRGCNICVVGSFLQSLKLPFFFLSFYYYFWKFLDESFKGCILFLNGSTIFI